MIFNGNNLGSLDWLVIEEAFPPEEIGRKNIWLAPTGAKSRLVRTTTQPYLRKVNVRIMAASRTEALWHRRTLAGLLDSEDVAKLELIHETTYEMAKLETMDTGNWEVETLPIELTFYCPSGCAFGAEQVKPIGTITVGGTEQTPPIWELTPTATTVKVSNGKQYVQLDGVSIGQPITIDVDNRMPKQGTTMIKQKVTFASDYFVLRPGQNNLQVTGATGNVRYTERWI